MPNQRTIQQRVAAIQDRARVRAEALALLRSGEGRALRTEAGMTQREVGELVGVGEAMVGLWETGDRNPNEEHSRRYLELISALRGES